MNGRVYDPAMGRMISADPRVQDPMNGQRFGRYDYVYDNPLMNTDPSGFDPTCSEKPCDQCIESCDGSGVSFDTAPGICDEHSCDLGSIDVKAKRPEPLPAPDHPSVGEGHGTNQGGGGPVRERAPNKDKQPSPTGPEQQKQQQPPPVKPCTAGGLDASRANNPNAGKNILTTGAVTGGAVATVAVAVNVLGFPEAEGVETSGAAILMALAGEPITSNAIIAFNFGGLGFATGATVGAVATTPVSPGCK